MKALKLPVGRQGCHFHGLRKTAGVKLAEAGCTAHEIMAILGCSMQNAEHCCKEAAQKTLATSGVAKREGAQNASATNVKQTKRTFPLGFRTTGALPGGCALVVGKVTSDCLNTAHDLGG